MGRSEPGGEKERELARMATMVIAAGGREGRQANDWRTFNEKTIKQAKTGLFIQNLCETEHPGDYERAGIFILESRRDLRRLYEMAPVRIDPVFTPEINEVLAWVKVHLEFCSRLINLTPKSLFPKSEQYRSFLSQAGSGGMILLAK